jgi:threonine dehydrogenase-like Zn-dependent dehydrogenase
MRTVQPKRIGLAIVGAGRVGLMRGEIAARFPQVDWIGIAEIDPERANLVGEKLGADFVTTDYRTLLRRPEVTAALISTVGHLHAEPTLAALDNPNKVALLIEKPIANDLAQSERVLEAIRQSGVDALIGYTQRFRRRWMVAKDKVARGELGDITTVSTRAFLNRMVALNAYRREPDPVPNSPMVIRTDRPTGFVDAVRGALAILPYEHPEIWTQMNQTAGSTFAPVNRATYINVIAIRDADIARRKRSGTEQRFAPA